MTTPSESECSDHHGTCSFSRTDCCWCLDKRANCTIYLDSYGTIEPEKYDIPMPKDLYYCVHCKKPTTPTVGSFTQSLRDALPNPDLFFRLKKIDDDIASFITSLPIRRKMSSHNTQRLTELNTMRDDLLRDIVERARKCIGNRIM